MCSLCSPDCSLPGLARGLRSPISHGGTGGAALCIQAGTPDPGCGSGRGGETLASRACPWVSRARCWEEPGRRREQQWPWLVPHQGWAGGSGGCWKLREMALLAQDGRNKNPRAINHSASAECAYLMAAVYRALPLLGGLPDCHRINSPASRKDARRAQCPELPLRRVPRWETAGSCADFPPSATGGAGLGTSPPSALRHLPLAPATAQWDGMGQNQAPLFPGSWVGARKRCQTCHETEDRH